MVDFKCKNGRDVEMYITIPELRTVYGATTFVWYGGLLLALYNYNGLVAPGLRLYNLWVHFHSVGFCVLIVFPAALPYTVRLVTRLQYQFTRSWYDPAKSRPVDLPAPKRTHLPLHHGLVRATTAVRQGTMVVSATREAPELIENALHWWHNEGRYSTLTHEEV